MSAVSAMISAASAVSAMSRLDSAKGDGDGENDRKECFHGTNVSLPLARVRLPVRRYARRHDDRLPRESTPLRPSPKLQSASLRLSAALLIVLGHLRCRFAHPALFVHLL